MRWLVVEPPRRMRTGRGAAMSQWSGRRWAGMAAGRASAACSGRFPLAGPRQGRHLGACSGIMRGQALVAQPDRVVASEAIGRGFESLRAHQMVPPGTSKKVQNPREIGGFFVACGSLCVHLDSLESVVIGGMDEGASPRTGTSMRIHLRRCAGLTPARQRRRPAGCCPLAQPVADRKLIERLQQSPDLLDIGALDHLVIGGRKNVSLAARRWGSRSLSQPLPATVPGRFGTHPLLAQRSGRRSRPDTANRLKRCQQGEQKGTRVADFLKEIAVDVVQMFVVFFACVDCFIRFRTRAQRPRDGDRRRHHHRRSEAHPSLGHRCPGKRTAVHSQGRARLAVWPTLSRSAGQPSAGQNRAL